MATKHVVQQNDDLKIEADSVALYIFLARIVNLMAFADHKKSAKELPKKVYKLELTIGCADKDIESIYDLFVQERQVYYTYYATDTLGYAK